MLARRPRPTGDGRRRQAARALTTGAMLGAWLFVGASSAQAATLLYFNSEAGDYIGQGLQFTLTPANGTIVADRTGGGVHVRFNGATWWDLYFVPPSGTTLAPGVYEGATRWPFQSPTTPGLSVSGDGRGCNTLTGRFIVLEAEYGAGGQVLRFAADYEQHCEGGNPALFGSVRFDSSVPLGPRLSVGHAALYEGDAGSRNLAFTVSLSGPATNPVTVHYATVDGTATAGSDYTAISGTASFPVGETVVLLNVPILGDTVEEPDETLTLELSNPVGAPIAFGQGQATIRNDDPYKTLIYFNSEAGDYIGQGQKFTLTPIDGTIVADHTGGGVHVHFDGDTWWDLSFVAPATVALSPGVYEGATRWPFQSPTTPGLDVSGDGRGCNTLTGRFTVLEAEYGAGSQVLRFAADYEQHCEGGNPALFGSVRFNSSVPLGPRLSVGHAALYEGDAGSRNLAFTVSLSGPATAPVTVNYATIDGTATAGSDYTAISGSASFPVGETGVLVNVPVLGDTAEEATETLLLHLTNPVGVPIAFELGVGFIINDDPYKTLITFNSEAGDYIGQGQQFTLTPADGTIVADRTGGGVRVRFEGATWWNLYFVPPSGTTLAPGVYEGATRWPFQSPATPGLDVSGDGRGCNTLTGRFTVLEAEYGTGGQVLRFAADYEQHCEGGNPALFGSVRFNSSVPLGPRFSVGHALVYEGDSGTGNLAFTVSLSAPATTPVTVHYATVDGTATAGSDYTAISGTASFPVGETVVLVSVPILGDTVEEADETLTLDLSNPVGAPIAFGQGQGTIRNDDPYKTLIYFNSEGGDYIGQGLRFTLTPIDGTIVADPTGGGVHVRFNGATWWDLYFVPPSGVPLTPGSYEGATRWPFQSPTTPGLSVSGDGRGCNTLTGRFTVLEAEFATGGQVVRFAADYEQHCEGGNPALFGSVRFNSNVPLGVRAAVAASSVLEGDAGARNLAFRVWLSEPSAAPVAIDFATADGTAVAGVDYAGYAGALNVPAGETDGLILVPVFGDTLSEADETFTVTLTAAVGAALGPSNVAVGTILNDDAAPQLSVDDVSVMEGNPWSSPTYAVFTVTLSVPSGATVTTVYATQQGSATVGEDFSYTSGTLQVPAGATSGTVSVPVLADVQTEGDETFSLLLFSPTNATLADDTGTGSILDDDRALSLHTLTPCRLLDTRQGIPLPANSARTVGAGGACGIPPTARAIVVNVTSVGPTAQGHLRLYAAGTAPPPTSVLNFAAGQTRSGNAIVGLGQASALTLRCYMPGGATHVVLDVFGYFE